MDSQFRGGFIVINLGCMTILLNLNLNNSYVLENIEFSA